MSYDQLGKIDAEIAVKRASLAEMFAEAEGLTDPAARDALASKIKSANENLNALADRRESAARNIKAENAARLSRQIPFTDSNEPSLGAKSTAPRPAGPDWGAAVLEQATQQADARGLKTLLPSGTAVVAVPVGGPIAEPRRARFLADLMPVEPAPGGNFQYLRQTVRDNQAAVVADGALKPTSTYTLELVSDTTDTIAHLSEPYPRHFFEDSERIRQFIEQEMRLGVNLAVDAKIVSEISGTSGVLTEGYISSSSLTTTRRALTRLQEREVDPSAFVFNPRDWEEVESDITATFATNSNVPAPTDEVRRSLFGYPVIVSNAVVEGTALLGDFRESAALFNTDGVRIDWSEAGDLFTHNEIQFRAEGRFNVAVYRPFAFVKIVLSGTGS